MVKALKKPVILSLLFAISLSFFSSQLSAQKALDAKDIAIVYIGNSITYGSNLEHRETEAPPVITSSLLSKRIRNGHVEFSNQGYNGCSTLDFLPSSGSPFSRVIRGADSLLSNHKSALLIFSIMLGTNDSAIKGPTGAPVSQSDYRVNLSAIIEELLHRYPECKIVINRPIWYSPNTYNRSEYLAAGLARLQSYFPEIDSVVNSFGVSHAGHIFKGDTSAFDYFKERFSLLTPESGQAGIFFLHPNKKGAIKLSEFWVKAIYKVVSSNNL